MFFRPHNPALLINYSPLPSLQTALLGVCAKKNPRLLILEYASKGSLDEYLKKKQKKKKKVLSLGQIVSVFADILQGLVIMHECELIHRDLTPKNILVLKEGQVLRAKLTGTAIISTIKIVIHAFDRLWSQHLC